MQSKHNKMSNFCCTCINEQLFFLSVKRQLKGAKKNVGHLAPLSYFKMHLKAA